jgi:tRNA threonylcarbamoyladenosine biosynthesis protein TsaB
MARDESVYLGLDTSSSFLSLALWSPKGTLASFSEDVGREHAQRIVPELNMLLQRARVQRQQIAGIGVGLGPGSYTGLRVGVATARGLAQGLGVRLSGSSSLAAMAFGVLEVGQRGVVALDARRGNVYAGVFVREAELVVLEGDIVKQEREALRERHADLPFFEHVSPDVSYLARLACVVLADEVTPIYL